MILTPAGIRESPGGVTLAFEVRREQPDTEPFELQFEVPAPHADFLSTGIEPALIAALFPAMATGETIRTAHPVSSRLAYGLKQIMDYFQLWFPDKLQTVPIEAPRHQDSPATGSRTTGMFFSGGVDSFYTLARHQADVESDPCLRPRYGVFVFGFDLTEGRLNEYIQLADRYEKVLQAQGMSLVRVRTNLRAMLDPAHPWLYTHGMGLASVAHALDRGFRTLLIPSTNRFSLYMPPNGSNPITDPWASSESLELLHHGCEASRINKVRAIAAWPPVREHLRVCWQETHGVLNCGACPKCLKTQLILWTLGALDHFPAFPPGFSLDQITPALIRPLNPGAYPHEQTFAEEWQALVTTLRPEAMARVNQLVPRTGRLSRWVKQFKR